MGSDIFTSVKGLTSPRDRVAAYPPSRSPLVQERRQNVRRLLQQNAAVEDALGLFRGKRLLGGNLLQGGNAQSNQRLGRSVEVTRSLFAEVQTNEDNAFDILFRQARERVAKNEFLPSAFNPVSSEERVRRLLANAPQSRVPRPYRFSTYDAQAERQRQAALIARFDNILQAASERLQRSARSASGLPDVSERPRIADILPDYLISAPQGNNINLNLVRRQTVVDFDTNTPDSLALNQLLRIYPSDSFLGLTSEAAIQEKQQELGLTDEQLEIQQQRDAASLPTHVQVTLRGKSLNFDPAVIAEQRRLNPNFRLETHASPAGELVLDLGEGNTRTLPSRSEGGAVLRHTLTYEEYKNLRYIPPSLPSSALEDSAIDYFSATPFRHSEGRIGVLNGDTPRGAVQVVSLTTAKTPVSTIETRNGVPYERYEVSLPGEHNGAFRNAEIIFEGSNLPQDNILAAIQSGDIEIIATQKGYNNNYIDNRELTLDAEELRERLGDQIAGNENRVPFVFFAPDAARNGLNLVVLVKQSAAITFDELRAQFS